MTETVSRDRSTGPVWGMTVAPAGRTPVGSGIDGSVRLWHPDVRARTAAVRRPARPLGGPRGNS
ncbi:hypothetical protein [Streptomyces sp. LUP47B]|uniref:hypothetical protein n=1 Tax=Streptomyces sp. LUP47B TaxID=1890286 RepID=UPI000851620D|nr:hypothetical protein [Streptomyces sp. LUP47B]